MTQMYFYFSSSVPEKSGACFRNRTLGAGIREIKDSRGRASNTDVP